MSLEESNIDQVDLIHKEELQKKLPSFGIVLIIISIISMVVPLSLDMYLPSFSFIAKDLGVETIKLQSTFSTYLFGMGIGQIFWGVLSDSLGRRNLMLISLILLAISSFLVSFSTTVYMMDGLRLVQGISAAAANIILMVVIKDVYSGHNFIRMVNYSSIIFLFAPLVAPLFGGYLSTWFNWKFIFYFISLFSLLSFFLYYYTLPETINYSFKKGLSFRNCLLDLYKITAHKYNFIISLMISLQSSAVFVYLSFITVIYHEKFGIIVEHIAYYFIPNIITIMLALQLNNYIFKKFKNKTILLISVPLQLIVMIPFIVVWYFDLSIFYFIISLPIFIILNPVISVGLTNIFMNHNYKSSGTAMSLLSSFRWLVPSFAVFIVSLIHIDSYTLMIFSMVSFVILTVLLFIILLFDNTYQSQV